MSEFDFCDCDTCSYGTNAISVRLGEVLPQLHVKNASPYEQWKHLCIEGWLYLCQLIV